MFTKTVNWKSQYEKYMGRVNSCTIMICSQFISHSTKTVSKVYNRPRHKYGCHAPLIWNNGQLEGKV